MLLDELYFKEKVIDIGCGNGIFTRKVAGKYNSIVSIDINKKRIENLITYCKENGIKNVIVKEMDAKRIEYQDNEFDLAIFYRSLDHISEYHSTLKEAYRVLKKGGVIDINVADTRIITKPVQVLDSLRNFEDSLFDIVKTGEGICEIQPILIEKVKTELQGIGFMEITEKIVQNESSYETEYYERITKKIEELLLSIKEASPELYNKMNAEYENHSKEVKKHDIGLRNTVEIVGIK
jgi:ubiquinone/menaquinone biosynthesis C-methylase UbiE